MSKFLCAFRVEMLLNFNDLGDFCICFIVKNMDMTAL